MNNNINDLDSVRILVSDYLKSKDFDVLDSRTEEDFCYVEIRIDEDRRIIHILDEIYEVLPDNVRIEGVLDVDEDSISGYEGEDEEMVSFIQINFEFKPEVSEQTTLTVQQLISRLQQFNPNSLVYVKLHNAVNGGDFVVNIGVDTIGVVKDDEYIREGISELLDVEKVDDDTLQQHVRIQINSVVVDVIFDSFDTFYK
jgi:hypothetical protein